MSWFCVNLVRYAILISWDHVASSSCRWSPTYDVSAILTSIQSLLSDPNPNSPANGMAAQLFKENRREYEKRVKNCVEQSWCDDWRPPSENTVWLSLKGTWWSLSQRMRCRHRPRNSILMCFRYQSLIKTIKTSPARKMPLNKACVNV